LNSPSLQLRSEILNALRRLLVGLGPSSASAHKDIYKCVRNGLGDKSMSVRSAAARVRACLSVCLSFYMSLCGLFRDAKSVKLFNDIHEGSGAELGQLMKSWLPAAFVRMLI